MLLQCPESTVSLHEICIPNLSFLWSFFILYMKNVSAFERSNIATEQVIEPLPNRPFGLKFFVAADSFSLQHSSWLHFTIFCPFVCHHTFQVSYCVFNTSCCSAVSPSLQMTFLNYLVQAGAKRCRWDWSRSLKLFTSPFFQCPASPRWPWPSQWLCCLHLHHSVIAPWPHRFFPFSKFNYRLVLVIFCYRIPLCTLALQAWGKTGQVRVWRKRVQLKAVINSHFNAQCSSSAKSRTSPFTHRSFHWLITLLKMVKGLIAIQKGKSSLKRPSKLA